MSSERQMRSNVLQILRKAGLDPRPVENSADPGFPDIEYVGGVLELKAIPRWPAKGLVTVAVPHYTQVQRIWHMRRTKAGGRVHVLLQVHTEFLLFDGLWAAQNLGKPGVNSGVLTFGALMWFRDLPALRDALVGALTT